jgi:hypothetical protein
VFDSLMVDLEDLFGVVMVGTLDIILSLYCLVGFLSVFQSNHFSHVSTFILLVLLLLAWSFCLLLFC